MSTRTSPAAKNVPLFGMQDKIGYALGDFGCNLSFALISTYMYAFYTQYIGISTAAWAAIILALKIWDAINDPLMGAVMDQVGVGKNGKFKPWIKIGSFGLVVSGALVFLPVTDAPYAVKVALCLGTYLVWDVCYTLVNVPYGALSAAMTAEPLQRQSLSTFRNIGAGLGGGISMLLPALVYNDNDELLGGRFIWLGLGMGALAFAAFSLLQKMTHERILVAPEQQTKINYFRTVKGFVTNRPLLGLGLASVSLIVFVSTATMTNQLIYQFYFKNTGYLTATALVGALPSIVMLPLVGVVVKKYGKRITAGLPLLLSIGGAAAMLLIPMNPENKSAPIVWIALSLLVQGGAGLFQLTTWAMVSDCIDYQQWKTGTREEGAVYACYSLFRKFAQGIGASLVPLTMTWVGYDEALKGAQLPGVPEKMKQMSALLLLIGTVLMCVSLLFVYNLDNKTLDTMRVDLGFDEKEKADG